MIEKTESQLRLSNSAAVSGLQPARPSAPTVAPDPGAEVGSAPFRSRLYPYFVQVPENWRVDPATRVFVGLGVELLAPPGGTAAGPNLATLGTELAPDVDTRGFVEGMRKALKAERIEPIDIGRRSVDGNEATLMRATVASERGKYVSTIAIFSHQGFGWLLIFSAAPDQSERLQPLFHQILDSFRMSDSSKVL